jgi:NADH-quinone oxidoreductase subunit A
VLRPNHPTKTKSEIYECGIDPVGGGWSQSHIRYYIFALLFLIFDVEAVFIFPWALNVEGFAEAGMGGFIFVEMVIFIVILLLGLVYAIRKGVLRWE